MSGIRDAPFRSVLLWISQFGCRKLHLELGKQRDAQIALSGLSRYVLVCTVSQSATIEEHRRAPDAEGVPYCPVFSLEVK